MKRIFSVLFFVLPLLLYIGTLTLRPLFLPAEYHFAAAVWEKYPWCNTLFLLRLPSALTVLAVAGVLLAAGKKIGMQYPLLAGGVYLLLPWIFIFGRAASPLILIAAPFALAALAELVIYRKKRGVGLSGLVVFSAAPYFFGLRSWYLVLLIASVPLSLILSLYLEAWIRRGNGGKADRVATAALWLLGGFVVLYDAGSVLQKHFHCLPFSFPVETTAVSLLLLPCLWLVIARKEEVIIRKVCFLSCAAAAVLITLPGLIPPRIRNINAPGKQIRQLAGSWNTEGVQLYEAEKCRGLLSWELKKKAMPLSELKMRSEKRDTVIALTERKNLIAQTPGVIYHTGMCYLYYYPAK